MNPGRSGKANGGLSDEVAFLNSKDMFARVRGLGCYFFRCETDRGECIFRE